VHGLHARRHARAAADRGRMGGAHAAADPRVLAGRAGRKPRLTQNSSIRVSTCWSPVAARSSNVAVPEGGRMTDREISIQLTPAQIDEVVRGASGEQGISSLLRGLTDERTLASKYRALSESPRLSRSLLLGLLVLACFPSDGASLAVSDIAERLGMSPSTTHRYMTTLLAVGLLEQEPRTRRYRVPVRS